MSDEPSAWAQAKEHELKCWPEFFSAILSGQKTFELRKDDRGFRAGDVLWLREWQQRSERYTGREMRVTVTYVLSGWGVEPGYVVMGFQSPVGAAARAEGPHAEVPGHAAYLADQLKTVTNQRDLWERDAQRYCQNADFWRKKAEQAEARAAQVTQERDSYKQLFESQNAVFAQVEASEHAFAARVARLTQALEKVEWCIDPENGNARCHWCDGWVLLTKRAPTSADHKPNCPRQLALGRGPGAEGGQP